MSPHRTETMRRGLLLSRVGSLQGRPASREILALELANAVPGSAVSLPKIGCFAVDNVPSRDPQVRFVPAAPVLTFTQGLTAFEETPPMIAAIASLGLTLWLAALPAQPSHDDPPQAKSSPKDDPLVDARKATDREEWDDRRRQVPRLPRRPPQRSAGSRGPFLGRILPRETRRERRSRRDSQSIHRRSRWGQMGRRRVASNWQSAPGPGQGK